jgi:hypothetical protein
MGGVFAVSKSLTQSYRGRRGIRKGEGTPSRAPRGLRPSASRVEWRHRPAAENNRESRSPLRAGAAGREGPDNSEVSVRSRDSIAAMSTVRDLIETVLS